MTVSIKCGTQTSHVSWTRGTESPGRSPRRFLPNPRVENEVSDWEKNDYDVLRETKISVKGVFGVGSQNHKISKKEVRVLYVFKGKKLLREGLTKHFLAQNEDLPFVVPGKR